MNQLLPLAQSAHEDNRSNLIAFYSTSNYDMTIRSIRKKGHFSLMTDASHCTGARSGQLRVPRTSTIWLCERVANTTLNTHSTLGISRMFVVLRSSLQPHSIAPYDD